MQTTFSTIEILGTIEEGSVEVCASADAKYDAASGKVFVTLSAFARRLSRDGHGEQLRQSWLPPDEMVMEHLPREDASAFGRDVFRGWVKKVHASISAELMLRT